MSPSAFSGGGQGFCVSPEGGCVGAIIPAVSNAIFSPECFKSREQNLYSLWLEWLLHLYRIRFWSTETACLSNRSCLPMSGDRRSIDCIQQTRSMRLGDS
jgi:hypothetical protein